MEAGDRGGGGGGRGVTSCCRNPLILSVTWRGGDGGGGHVTCHES